MFYPLTHCPCIHLFVMLGFGISRGGGKGKSHLPEHHALVSGRQMCLGKGKVIMFFCGWYQTILYINYIYICTYDRYIIICILCIIMYIYICIAEYNTYSIHMYIFICIYTTQRHNLQSMDPNYRCIIPEWGRICWMTPWGSWGIKSVALRGPAGSHEIVCITIMWKCKTL